MRRRRRKMMMTMMMMTMVGDFISNLVIVSAIS